MSCDLARGDKDATSERKEGSKIDEEVSNLFKKMFGKVFFLHFGVVCIL